MPIATIAENDRKERFIATAGQTVFPYDFPIYAAADLQVRRERAGAITLLTLGTDYSVTGVQNQTGGNVVLTTGATAGDIIVILSAMSTARAAQFVNGGDLAAATLEAELNRIRILFQQNARDGRNALLFPPTDPVMQDLPPIALRANRFLAFDSNGQPIAATPIAGTVLDALSRLGDNMSGRLGFMPGSAVLPGLTPSNDQASGFFSGTNFIGITINGQEAARVISGGLEYRALGTGATSRPLRDKLSEYRSIKDFGAVGNGINNDTASIIAAINAAGPFGTIEFPYGNYQITSTLTPLQGQRWISPGGRAFIQRAFSGAAMIDGSADQWIMEGLHINGAGTQYGNVTTDIGILFSNAANAYQTMRDVWMADHAGPCLQFSVADAANRSKFFSCIFTRTNPANPAILLPTSTETTGGREFHECRGGGGVLLRFNQGINTRIIGGDTTNLDFSGSDNSSIRAIVQGMRIAPSGANFTIRGNDSIISGCSISGPGVIEGPASRNIISGNLLTAGSTWTDNSTATGTNMNLIDYSIANVTPIWGADGTQPAIGNGIITGRVVRRGRTVKVDVSLGIGSTTTFGTSNWYFELPAPFNTWNADVTATGLVRILDSGTAWMMATAWIAAGTRRIYMSQQNGGAQINSSVPMTWATGDSLLLQIEFELA